MDYVKLLRENNKIELFEPITLAKDHHKMRCMVCNHNWTATPLSKTQTFKKYGVGGCPACKTARVERQYIILRQKNIELLKARGLTILSEYDGKRTNKKVKFFNTKCGHTFEASANNMIFGDSKCIVCGKQNRITAATNWSKANSAQLKKTADEWLLYKAEVAVHTEREYRQYQRNINPNDRTRALAGVNDAYHLDHIVSVRMCFDNMVPPNVCADKDNLQMIPWGDNITSRHYIKGTIPPTLQKYFPAYTRLLAPIKHLQQLMPYSKLKYGLGDGITADIYSKKHNFAVFVSPLDKTVANQKIFFNTHQFCKKKNIKGLMIFEDELRSSPDLIDDKITHMLNISNKPTIHARKCTIEPITKDQKKILLNKYHLQGNDRSQVMLGAFFQDELIAAMTFCKPRVALGYKNSDRSTYDSVWELSRFATVTNYRIPGIASKLLMHFKRNTKWTKIISYADNRWSTGNLYYQLGFVLEATNPPDYFYIIDGVRKHRWNYRKDILRTSLANFNSKLTEYQNMVNHGFYRIWDCGTMRFVLNNNPTIDSSEVSVKHHMID